MPTGTEFPPHQPHLPPHTQSTRDMQNDIENAASPGLWRRLAAIFYDSWLVAALWLLGATGDYFIQTALGTGEAPLRLPLQLYLLAAPVVFFGWFWTHGGQTLGMRAWRLKLLARDARPVTWRQALVRFAGAWLSLLALGLGYLWVWIDGEHQAWHDRLSGTRLVMTSKS